MRCAAAALRGMLRTLWLLLAGYSDWGLAGVDARSAGSIAGAVSERQGARGHELGRPVERLQVHPLLGSPLLDQGAQLIIGLHHHPAVYGLPSDHAEVGACTRRPPPVRTHRHGAGQMHQQQQHELCHLWVQQGQRGLAIHGSKASPMAACLVARSTTVTCCCNPGALEDD